MAATAQPITKVDSAVSDVAGSPTEDKIGHRRKSSSVTGVFNINDLGMWLSVITQTITVEPIRLTTFRRFRP